MSHISSDFWHVVTCAPFSSPVPLVHRSMYIICISWFCSFEFRRMCKK